MRVVVPRPGVTPRARPTFVGRHVNVAPMRTRDAPLVLERPASRGWQVRGDWLRLTEAAYLVWEHGNDLPIGVLALYGSGDVPGEVYMAASRLGDVDDGRSILMMLGCGLFIDSLIGRPGPIDVLRFEISRENYPQIDGGLGRLFEIDREVDGQLKLIVRRATWEGSRYQRFVTREWRPA